MTGSRGFSLVEVIVATAILLAVTGAVFELLAATVRRSPVWNDDADLQQRARVVVEALSAEVRAAGAGGASGPLRAHLAPIEPRGADGELTAAAITVRYVPDGGEAGDLVEAIFVLDERIGVLRRVEPGHGEFPLVDAVERLHVEYFDAAASSLPLAEFGDGPFCTSGTRTFDCDALRIRRIRVTVGLRSRLAAPLTLTFEVAPWNLGL